MTHHKESDAPFDIATDGVRQSDASRLIGTAIVSGTVNTFAYTDPKLKNCHKIVAECHTNSEGDLVYAGLKDNNPNQRRIDVNVTFGISPADKLAATDKLAARISSTDTATGHSKVESFNGNLDRPTAALELLYQNYGIDFSALPGIGWHWNFRDSNGRRASGTCRFGHDHLLSDLITTEQDGEGVRVSVDATLHGIHAFGADLFRKDWIKRQRLLCNEVRDETATCVRPARRLWMKIRG